MKKKFVIHFVAEGEMLEKFTKEINENNGKIPETISKIFMERYNVKDTIKRGYSHLKITRGLKIELTKGTEVRRFESVLDASDFLICSRTMITNRLKESSLKIKEINGWKVRQLK